jgi:acetyltransferase-like isoleucine patch superfamily enzyme
MRISRIFYYCNMFLKKRHLRCFLRVFEYIMEDHVIPFNQIKRAHDAYIHPSVSFRSPENIIIHRKTRIQPYVCLWASPKSKIIIGEYTGLGPSTMLFSSNHKYEFGKIYVNQPWVEENIIIGKNVWVGAGCIITAGVHIGDGAVVGAGSVVNQSIPPYSLAVGVPAKVVKSSNESVTYERS